MDAIKINKKKTSDYRRHATIRKAFVMVLHPDQCEEYRRRHDALWPELAQVLQEHGVHNYSIFHDAETNRLFAYAETEDEARWAAIANTDVCQRWWRYMADIMMTNPDNSPKAVNLQEVFHLK